MSSPAPPIVLASASPRRRVLLERAGLCFEVRPAGIDEELEPGAAAQPLEAAALLAERKARAVAQDLAGGARWVIGSDTVVAVAIDGELRLLGKPADGVEARRMLGWLSGTRHQVVTGVSVVRCADGRAFTAAERTWVTMRPIEPGEIETYVASGEWRDKAGGYAIQETADAFVTGLSEGGFDNVVGLPVGLTFQLLERAGAPLAGGGDRQ